MGAIGIGILGLIGLILLIVAVVVTRIKVAGPNEAFIVTGRKGRPVTNPETGAVSTDLSGQKVVMGASVFVLPVIQKLASIDLSARQISVGVGSAVSAQGIKCSLEGVAIVKVGGAEDSIRAAAQRFLGQQDHIEHFTQEVLAGSLRSIVGRLSVEEIVKDRAAFAREVAEEAETSLTNQGLVLDTFQLQDIQTEGDHLKNLGRPEMARAEKEAAIAESIARREAAAQALRAEGEAEASAILARGEAEASAMGKKADAYELYGDAAVVDLLSQMLPRLVKEAAAPMASIDKVTVISTDGASQLTKSVASNVTQGMQLATDLLGVDLQGLFQRLANGDRAGLMPPAPPSTEAPAVDRPAGP